MKTDTVIFDLDGTLLNTLESLADSTNFALEKFGYEKKSIDEVRNFIGNGVKTLIELAIPGGEKNEKFNACLTFFKEHYSKNMNEKTKIYAGIPELLEELRKKNYKIAVVSNKFDSAVKSLCEKEFGNLIDVAIGEGPNVGKKPSPSGVFEALKKLGSSVKNAVYVGDSEVDVETAKNSGLPCISVTWGFKDEAFLRSKGASVFISKPSELFSCLDSFK